MKVLKGIVSFCYDFVVGEDWKIAGAVVIAALITAILAAAGVSAGIVAVVATVALMVLFAVAVLVDVRRSGG